MQADQSFRKLAVDAVVAALLDGCTPPDMSPLHFEFFTDTDPDNPVCRLDLTGLNPVIDSSRYQFIGDAGSTTVTGVVVGNGRVSTFAIYNDSAPNDKLVGTIGGYLDAGVDLKFNNTLWTTGAVVLIQNLMLDMATMSVSGVA